MNVKVKLLIWAYILSCGMIYAQADLKDERQKQIALKLELADSLYKEGRLKLALTLYDEFIELYPESQLRYRALENRALILEEQQEFMGAVKTYGKLYQFLGISEKGLGYYLQQGILYERLGLDKKALKIYEDITRLKSASPVAEKARKRRRLLQLIPLTQSPDTQINTN